MDIELLIVLAGSFFGLIFIVVIALQNFGNRIEDKLGNRDTIVASKFDLLIDKISAIAIDFATTAKELKASLLQNSTSTNHGFNFLNIDVGQKRSHKIES